MCVIFFYYYYYISIGRPDRVRRSRTNNARDENTDGLLAGGLAESRWEKTDTGYRFVLIVRRPFRTGLERTNSAAKTEWDRKIKRQQKPKNRIQSTVARGTYFDDKAGVGVRVV